MNFQLSALLSPFSPRLSVLSDWDEDDYGWECRWRRAQMALEDVTLTAEEAALLQRQVLDLLACGSAELTLGQLRVHTTLLGQGAVPDSAELQRVALRYQTEKQALCEGLEDFLTDTTTARPSLDGQEESALARLRQEAELLRSPGQRLPPMLQRELDYAEDLLVRVQHGEDAKHLQSQLTVVASALVQVKVELMAASTAKLATSLNAKLAALERTPVKRFRKLEWPSKDSSVNTTVSHPGFLDLREKVERYRALEDSFAVERGRLKADAQELHMRKCALDRREQALFQQELTVALREDQLRSTICRTLLSSEAHEYMRHRANELLQERFLLEKERQHLETHAAALQRREVEAKELKLVLERRLRKVARDQAKAREAETKLKNAKTQLRAFLLNMP